MVRVRHCRLRIRTTSHPHTDPCGRGVGSWGVEARERVSKEGLTVEGREGLKTHPSVAIERDARAAFARLVAQLGLDDADEPKRGVGNPGLGGVGISFEQLQGLPPRTRRGRKQ